MRRPPKSGTNVRNTNTLLVDGNALFKTGFHGAKNQFNKNGQHIGGLYQFITVVRKILNENVYQRVYVFWDGSFSGKKRWEIYPEYKIDRGKDYLNGTKPQDKDQILERFMIQGYLEDLFIRQITNENIVEGDDFIAYYCRNKKLNDKVTIITNDGDLCQLVSESVQIYLCGAGKKYYVTDYNFLQIFGYKKENLVLIKTICGDSSDSITGVKGMGVKTLLDNFPEIKQRTVSLQEILVKAQELQSKRLSNKKPPLKAFTNLIEGITVNKITKKDVKMGMKLYKRNDLLVDLSTPSMMTKNSITKIKTLMESTLDPEGRGIKEAYSKMKRDGIDVEVGSTSVEYLLPFKKLMEREKKEFITENK